MKNIHGDIIAIGDILVSEEVVTEYFACDYPVCRGVCCIEGDSGAPLSEEETELLERDYPHYSAFMSPSGRAAAEDSGFFAIDREGDLVTPVVPGSEECAYIHTAADGSVLCAIEKCHAEGLCGFCKPISCRLYPIRVVRLGGDSIGLNLHRWKICAPAFEKGRREGIRVYQFLRTPLTAAFGEEFYSALCAAAAYCLRS